MNRCGLKDLTVLAALLVLLPLHYFRVRVGVRVRVKVKVRVTIGANLVNIRGYTLCLRFCRLVLPSVGVL